MNDDSQLDAASERSLIRNGLLLEVDPLPEPRHTRPIWRLAPDMWLAALVALCAPATGVYWFGVGSTPSHAVALLAVPALAVLAWRRPRGSLLIAMLSLAWWAYSERAVPSDWGLWCLTQAGRSIALGGLVVWIWRCRNELAQSEVLARLDSLTRLPNRRAIVETLTAELTRSQRTGRPFTVALFDCDGFKQLNDRRGHIVGDDVLKKIGVALRQHTRSYDCVGRWGGDEFLLVLCDADANSATFIVERLRAALRHHVERDYPEVTFSLGVVTFLRADLDWQTCFRQADEAMYRAKRAGRDRTEFDVVASLPQETIPIKG